MSNEFISPMTLAADGHWNAAVFVGAAATVRKIAYGGVRIGDWGRCLEGWRGPGKEGTYSLGRVSIPVFRQPNLALMQFEPEDEHWQAPQVEELWCVQPGDIVVNRTLPFRAAWATPALHRHPVDANCLLIRIRKAGRAATFWTALCLNQPVYTSYLAALSRTSLLPRLTISILSGLKLPPIPEEAETLAAAVWDNNDAKLQNEAVLAKLKAEVEEYILKEDLPRSLASEESYQDSLTPGNRFPAEDIEDSLIPKHIELSHFQRGMEKDLRWVRVADLLVDDGAPRVRLDRLHPGVPFIRLSDLNANLAISWTKSKEDERMGARAYREPLIVGEVLLSTLVSNPRVAYAAATPAADIYITDHLERLRFRETPGAWALLLQTSVARKQLERSAIGTAQQFATRSSIQQIRLPHVPKDKRIQWEQALIRHHQRRAELEIQWEALWPRAQALFDKFLIEASQRRDKDRTERT